MPVVRHDCCRGKNTTVWHPDAEAAVERIRKLTLFRALFARGQGCCVSGDSEGGPHIRYCVQLCTLTSGVAEISNSVPSQTMASSNSVCGATV
jgi:hypothetical protein